MNVWIIRLATTAGVAVLAACGSAADLRPAANHPLPPAPYGARATPGVAQLLSATDQQRPQRSDELLTHSDERRGDDFDLPPPN